MDDDNGQLSIQDLVLRSKEAYGLTWSEMGHQLGRSEKMLRKLSKGESPGEGYRKSLTELYEVGQVKHLTPRRRRKDGQLAPVRAKSNAKTKSVSPIDTKGERAPSVKRGRFRHEIQNLPGGNRITLTDLPKTPKSQGRKKGWDSIKDELRRVSKSQARKDKRVKVRVVLEDNDGERRIVNIGQKSGYHASDILTDVRTEHGGDMQNWVMDQLDRMGNRPGVSVPADLSGFRVVQVEQTSFDATRTKVERQEQDRTGRRRWGQVRESLMNKSDHTRFPTAGLREILLEALESTASEDALAEQIAASGALGAIVDLATYDANQTAQALQIQPDSVRKLMRQSASFPRPAVNERRYARRDVEAYAQSRQKKNRLQAES